MSKHHKDWKVEGEDDDSQQGFLPHREEAEAHRTVSANQSKTWILMLALIVVLVMMGILMVFLSYVSNSAERPRPEELGE